MSQLRRRFALVFVALLVVLVGCQDEKSSTVDPTELTLAFTPASATATASPRDGYTWRATFDVTIASTIGASVTSVNATLYEAAGGIVVSTPDQDEDVVVAVSASGSRIEAGTSRTIGITVDYRLPAGGREAVVDVAVAVTDDNDSGVSETERIAIY